MASLRANVEQAVAESMSSMASSTEWTLSRCEGDCRDPGETHRRGIRNCRCYFDRFLEGRETSRGASEIRERPTCAVSVIRWISIASARLRFKAKCLRSASLPRGRKRGAKRWLVVPGPRPIAMPTRLRASARVGRPRSPRRRDRHVRSSAPSRSCRDSTLEARALEKRRSGRCGRIRR